MATNGPIPMKLTVVDDGGLRVLSSTRINLLANQCTKSNAGQSTSEKLSQEGLTTRNNLVNVSMKIESEPKKLGIVPSVLDTGSYFMVNAVPKPVNKTLSSQVDLQVPVTGGVPRLNLASTQKRLQATSANTFLLAGNSAPTATQTSLKQNVAEMQNRFLPNNIQVYQEKGNMPSATHTVQQYLPQSPRPMFFKVKDQLSLLRQQQSSQESSGLLKNIIIKRVNGPVSSSPTSSRPNQFASSLPKTQQSCIVVNRIPNILSNSRRQPSKQLSDVDRKSIVNESNTSMKVFTSMPNLGGNQPVFPVNPPHPSSKAVNQSILYFLVSSPNHPPTLVPYSLLGSSVPPLLSNQTSSSTPENIPHTLVGKVSHPPNCLPKTCAANIPVVQVKRTHDQDQDSMRQPNKKLKSTKSSEIYIKKEPEDNSKDVLSKVDTRTTVQNQLSKHHVSGVSHLNRNNQVDNVGVSSSGSGNNQPLGNCQTETISMKTEVSTPSSDISQTIVTSNQLTRATVATSNVASCSTISSMPTSVYLTNNQTNKQTIGNNTGKQIMPMKTFIVTDKSGKTRVLNVRAATPASNLLDKISKQCKGKKLNLTTLQLNGGTDSTDTSTGSVVVVTKVPGGVKQGEQGSLKTKETGSKCGVDLTHGVSKSRDGTDNVGVKECEPGSLTTEKMLSKTNAKCNVDMKQRELKSSKSKSTECSNIVTRSKTRHGKRIGSKQTELKSSESKSSECSNVVTRSKTRHEKRRISRRRRKKIWAFCIERKHKRKRQTKSYDAKVQILDHNYSFRPESCKMILGDKSKMTSEGMMNSSSVDSESTKDFSSNFEKPLTDEKQLTEEEGGNLPKEIHYPEEQLKVTLPTVALKPLKLKPEDHFKTIVVLSESLSYEGNQIEIKNTSRGIVQDCSKDSGQNNDTLNFKGYLKEGKTSQKQVSDQNSDGLNFKSSLKERSSQKLSNSTEFRNKGTVLPPKMTESLTVFVREKVKLKPEISIKCEDELLQTSEESAHLEEQPETVMEIPSDLSLMSGKDRIKILRERMRRREREIAALTMKSVKQESMI